MSNSIFALPVSVEQIAAVIKQMSKEDQQRLLELVPELGRTTPRAVSRTVDEARISVAKVKSELLNAITEQLVSPDEPFLGDLTLEEYLNLPEKERSQLWDQWSDVDLEKFDEIDVESDAMST